MPIDDEANTNLVTQIMKQYFSLGTEELKLEEAESTIYLKHGYVRLNNYFILG